MTNQYSTVDILKKFAVSSFCLKISSEYYLSRVGHLGNEISDFSHKWAVVSRVGSVGTINSYSGS